MDTMVYGSFAGRIARSPRTDITRWSGRGSLRSPGTKEHRFYVTCTTPGVRYTLRAMLHYHTVTQGLMRGDAVIIRDFSFQCVGAPSPVPVSSPARITGVRLANAAKVVIHGEALIGRVYLSDPTGVVSEIRISASGAGAPGVTVTPSIPIKGANDPTSGIPFGFTCTLNGPVKLVFTLLDRAGRPFAPFAYDLHCF